MPVAERRRIPLRTGRNAQQLGRGWLWLLASASLVTVAGFAVLFTGHWTWARELLCAVLTSAAACFLLTLADPERFWWALRIVAGLVAAGYLAAILRLTFFPLAGELGAPLPLLFLATAGFMVCGVPALSFVLWGHTRGRMARDDAGEAGAFERHTARLMPAIAYGTWFAIGVYLLHLLVQ
ncbi:MAG TPA: hypothetical protein VFV77_08690 [Gammaproteobacteria bacterium]|nr:hypothetical protein [Gammaproteobacteria bacterium]